MDQNALKKQAALAALEYVEHDSIVGVGTGSTIGFFIEGLASIKSKINAAVASSKRTADKLRALNIPVIDLNVAGELSVYIDGADEIDRYFQMIKGGGAALTGEKILASTAKKFICIVDQTKCVDLLGQHAPVPVEVIPLARSAVGRAIVKLGGNPVYRENVVTDYGNYILDVTHLDLTNPTEMESILNNIPGVVCNGIFAHRKADILLLAKEGGVKKMVRAA
jgi:ribose 5-phosphate isomerase A